MTERSVLLDWMVELASHAYLRGPGVRIVVDRGALMLAYKQAWRDVSLNPEGIPEKQRMMELRQMVYPVAGMVTTISGVPVVVREYVEAGAHAEMARDPLIFGASA